MSWFSSITNAISGTAVKVLNAEAAIVSNPITAITQGIPAAVQKWQSSTPLQNTLKIGVNTAVASGLVLGGAAAASAGVVGSAKAVVTAVTTYPKTALAATVAIPAIASSNVLQQSIENAPSSIVNFGSNIGKTIDNPSVSNVKSTVKENPILSAAAGVAAVVATGYGVSSVVSAVSNYQNTQAVKENTAATNAAETINPQAVHSSDVPIASNSPEVVAPTLSAAPSGGTKKKKKAKKKAKKKTRRSKKKPAKKKKKNIKRRKK